MTRNVQAVHDIQHELWSGKVTVFTSEVVDDDFVQPRNFWREVLGGQEGQQENLVRNVAGDLANVKEERVRREAISKSCVLHCVCWSILSHVTDFYHRDTQEG